MNNKGIKGEYIFSAFLFLVILVFLSVSLNFNQTARNMPIIVGLFALISMISYFYDARKTERNQLYCKEKEKAQDSSMLQHLQILVWLLILFANVVVLGLIWGSGVFTLIFEKIEGKRTWLQSFIFSTCLLAFLQIVFVLVLKARLYHGVLGLLNI